MIAESEAQIQLPFAPIHLPTPARWPTKDDLPTARMQIKQAGPDDLDVVLGLIDEASTWLRDKETNQWARPWPNRKARDARVLAGLTNGKTWIVWDGDTAAATVTLAARANPAVWSKPGCDCDLSQRAVYVHRLITARNYSGWDLGVELVDWAGLRGRRLYGARWARIDVWTTNLGLHGYYMKRGFQPCGFCADPDYPSGALFQKPVSKMAVPSFPQFVEVATAPATAQETRQIADAAG